MKIKGVYEYGTYRSTDTVGLGIFMWYELTEREITIQIGHRVWYLVLNGGRMRVL